MAFKRRIKSKGTVTSPITLFRDLKNREVKGLLDHQKEMIEKYMIEGFDLQDVAMELPTGSGKTLVGLLIGEYRRRVNREKVIYLCPTKQLVNQVVGDSEKKYGIKTIAFTGKQSEYDPRVKAQYTQGDVIAVTTYSGLFNTNTYFNDADLIILDDAHASENYIASLWSLTINRFDNSTLYNQVVELLKSVLTHSHYETMKARDPFAQEKLWVEKLPTLNLYEYINELVPLIDGHVERTSLQYSWSMIRNNIHACHLYMSWNEILIRPLTPPSLQHRPFAGGKQRIYMSATLGLNGDLERMIGIPKIHRLTAPEGWDTQGLGRRLFLFPETVMSEDKALKFTARMISQVNRSLILVPDEKNVTNLEQLINQQTNHKVIKAKEIEESKEIFTKDLGVVAILANRFDGIDLADDDCRLLILKGIPRATHLQEKFLMSRMAASIIFNDRVRTRLVQAVGRCTRHPVDYAAVCVLGEELTDELVSRKKLGLFHPELQAEIKFGYEQSVDVKNEEELLENLNIFLNHGDEWNEADQYILEERNEREQSILPAFNKLFIAAKYEVNFIYALWNQDFNQAFLMVQEILANLDGDDVKGYRSFWYYIGGSTAWMASKQGITTYSTQVYDYYRRAAACTNAIPWLNKLANLQNNVQVVEQEDAFIPSLIEGLEGQLNKLGLASNRRFEKEVNGILEDLKSEDGKKFERGHEKLGSLLGYDAKNSEESSAPDPWWIIENEICLVFEDKIYESPEKRVPAKDVKQSASHPIWIREKIQSLDTDADIVPIMVTTSKYIEQDASVFAQNVFYWNRDEFLQWAHQAVATVRILRQSYSEPGDPRWRAEAIMHYKHNNLGPLQIIDILKDKYLKNLPN
ncbi:DEAD/DEAH box helicase [Priestia megaterium]|uniref:DEAD/DEAH box helicase n=1 Tax=Priestia megaterium TaxID=1404 RepID=UPI0011BB01DC|nr:DEAD/DEAH box helicase [Priestia megaterium]QDZ80153.1 DEAD/DEAH box helicase [Priestia megaterium]